jgi:uroporphyrinogen decarboxylase
VPDTLIDYITGRDRRLVWAWMGTTGARLSGHTIQSIYASPERQLEVALLMDETFGLDFAYPLDDGHIFRAALDVPMLCPDFDFPSTLEPIIRGVDDIARLDVPDPARTPCMAACLAGLDAIGGAIAKPLFVSMEGPFTLAAELVGVTGFLRALIKDPDFAGHVLSFTVETVSRFAAAVVEHGGRFVAVCEPTAANLSPAHFERYVLPGFRKVFDQLRGAWTLLHVCGDTNHLLGPILEAGADAINLESQVDFPALARRAPDDVVLVGNIDPFLIAEGNMPDIAKATTQILRDMRPSPNFLVSTACEVVPGTSVERIQAFLDAARTPTDEL